MNTQLFRIEKDSLGEVQVPADALFGAQTQRAVDNFPISTLKPWKAHIWAMAAIKLSAARINSRLGLLNQEFSTVISQAAQEIMDGKWHNQFVVDPYQAGAGTSHNMNVNEVIANRATLILGGNLGEYIIHPNDHVNMSQSTNDTIPTAIRLGCLWRLDELLTSCQNLSNALLQKGLEFDSIIKSGRTHLQDAVPVRLGQEFTAYGHAVARDTERVKNSARSLSELGIGGTAVGSGLNAHQQYHHMMVDELSAISGLSLSPSTDLFERMQSMADMVDFSSAMRTMATTLIRIANDLRLLSSGPSTGLDEIHLPAVQPGSSIMPGKVNPVMAEMLDMAMFQITGYDTTIMMAAQAGQLELNVMMPVIAHNLFGMMQIMIGSIDAFTQKCVTGIEANRDKAQAWLEKNSILITALNPIIGYSKGAELVKEAIQKNIPIKDIALQKAKSGALINKSTGELVTREQISEIFDHLRNLTEGGILQ